MKNRTVLYGYCYESGKITFQPAEVKIIKEIFSEYRQGKSLLKIAESLNANEVEYMPGVVGWNKSRIMRLIEDKRYLGDENYPALIIREEYNELQSIREDKNTQKNINRTDDIFQIEIPFRCSKCNARMRRCINKRAAIPIRWICQARQCRMSIGKMDDNVIANLTELLNKVIEYPEMINIPEAKEPEFNTELRKLNGEINRIFDTKKVVRDEVRKKMVAYASVKYLDLDSSVIKSQILKDIFSKSMPMKTFSLDFLERTVDEIKIYEDGSLGIVLENGQEIRQEGKGCS